MNPCYFALFVFIVCIVVWRYSSICSNQGPIFEHMALYLPNNCYAPREHQTYFKDQDRVTFVVVMGFILITNLHHKLLHTSTISYFELSGKQMIYMWWSTKIQCGNMQKNACLQWHFNVQITFTVGIWDAPPLKNFGIQKSLFKKKFYII